MLILLTTITFLYLLITIFRFQHFNFILKKYGILKIYKFYFFYTYFYIFYFFLFFILILKKIPFFNFFIKNIFKNKTFESSLTGDNVLSGKEKIFYSFYFFLEFLTDNRKNSQFQSDVSVKNFINFVGETNLKEIFKLYSPPRIACDKYLFAFLKKNFNQDHAITILDFGCGSGRYFKIFNNYFKKLTYIGIDKLDINNKWVTSKTILDWGKISKKNKNAFFYNTEIDNDKKNLNNILEIRSKFKKIDFIFSISVLEHIKKDQDILKFLNFHFKNAKNLHIVPAPLSYLAYLEHGFRRYTIQRIKKFPFNNISVDEIGSFKLMRYYFYFNKIKNIMPHYFFSFLEDNIFNKNIEEEFLKINSQKKNIPLFRAFYF